MHNIIGLDGNGIVATLGTIKSVNKIDDPALRSQRKRNNYKIGLRDI